MKHAVVLQHVAFEDLGTLQPLLLAQSWQLQVLQAGVDALDPAEAADLLVVLGGPISVNDVDVYPFLNDSIALLQGRLQQQRPTLGICLGAQLMARALGADVAASGGKEIGFAPLLLTDDGQRSPLQALQGIPVLHWHGEAFELPAGARRLASTPERISASIITARMGCSIPRASTAAVAWPEEMRKTEPSVSRMAK